MRRGLAIAGLLIATAGVAAADVCDDAVDEPAAIGWRDAGFDAGRAACPRADVTASVRGRALIDTPGFYGTLGGELAITARFVARARYAWGVTARAVDVAYIQNAVWKLVDPSYGPIGVHGMYSRPATIADRPARVAAVAAVELPFTRSALDGSSGAIQLGALATWQVGACVQLHARLAALGWYGRSITGTSTRGAALAAVDVSWHARPWLGVDAGVDVQGGWYGVGLDHVAARVGVHGRIRGAWRTALAVGAPVVGAERQNLALTAGVSRDLD